MLNYRAVFEHHFDPFELHLAHDVLSPAEIRRLYDTVPKGIPRFSRDDPGYEKQYAMNLLFLVEGDRADPGIELAPAWQDLVRALQGPAFLDWLEAGVGQTLRHLVTDIGIYTHDDGDFISIHKDKAHKALTAVLYLNPEWPEAAGGAYEVRRSADPSEPAVRLIPPTGGQLLAFPPTDRSWHAVAPVTSGGELTRLTVQLEFWFEKKPR